MKNFVLATFVCLGISGLRADPLPVPNGKKGAAYRTYSLPRVATASGLDFKHSGRMPKGLSLSRGGTLSGTPQETGPFVFTVDVSGGTIGKTHFKQDYSITIDPPDPVTNPLLSTLTPPGAQPVAARTPSPPVNPLIVSSNAGPAATVSNVSVNSSSTTSSSPPADAGSIPTPEFRGGLAPGQTQVWVAFPFAPPGTTGNKLTLRVDGSPAGLLDSSGSNVAFISPDLSTQQAMMTLAVPLATGQVVTSELMADGASAPAQSVPATVVDPLDLGKIRYYFTSGVVLSNNQGFQLQSSGTQAGLFLGLDVDRSWLSVQPHGLHRIGINSYFDARLTSVPTQGVQAGSGTTTADTFLQSQKAATLQAGVYLPVMTNDWTPSKTPYSFSVAPIGKAGFTTLTDQTPQSGTATTPSPASTGRFFTSYSFGTRLGIHKVHKDGNGDWDRNSSPESIGYFDITMGRFGNFEAFRDLQAQFPSLAANQSFQTERPWRYSFEGIVKIPPVFVIGFSANIGRGAPPPVCGTTGDAPCGSSKPTLYPFLPPHDDLRFMFGAQFDFRQVLKKLPAF